MIQGNACTKALERLERSIIAKVNNIPTRVEDVIEKIKKAGVSA